MFCPKCGNELSEGAEFCAACGKQIIKEDAAKSALQNNLTNGVAGKKPILIGVIAIVAILAVVLIIKAINKPSDSQETRNTGTTTSKHIKGGFDSYEDVIDALFTSAYNKDVEAVINCFPKEMESYGKKLYNAYRSSETGWSGDNLNYTTGMFFSFEKLNMDNEYWYEIVGATELEQSDMLDKPSVFTKDKLQTEYGLTFDEAYIVEIKSMGKYYTELFGRAGYTTDGCRGYFEVAKIGKKWYVLRVDKVWVSNWYK